MLQAPSDRLDALEDSVSGQSAGATLMEIVRAIREARTLWITAHANPDGDALGSSVALGLGLTALGKRTQVLFDSPLPERLVSLVPAGSFRALADPASLLQEPSPDLFILLDTSEPDRAGGIGNLALSRASRSACLDHHLHRGPTRFHHHLVLTSAPSTGNLVLALLRRLGGPLTRDIARALWMAICTDTGWFRFENTGAWALEDAAALSEIGLEIPAIYRQIYEDSSPGRARILGKVLAGLRSECGGAFVYGLIKSSDLAAEGLTLADLDGIVDHLKSVRGGQIVALLVETGPCAFKVSLRALGTQEVESLARKLGGGGHAKAAGGRFSGTLEQLLDLLRQEMGKRFPASSAP